LIIVISLACLLAGGIWLRNRRLLAQATLPPLALTQAPAAGQAPLPGESERLQALLQQVQQDPDNRDTHAKLALEYLRLDQPEPAAAELEQVIALGKDDYRFFLEISDVFASDGFWIAATRLALQGARFHPRPWPPEVTERVREYSYRAAGNPEIEPVIGPQVAPESELSGLLELSRARFQVLHGDLEKAGQVVERLLRDAPGDPLVHLLNAEMLLRRGDPRTARVVLQDLTGRQDIPDWIRRMAVELLESMPK
jgi:predicted Zn-dependent protease